MIIIKLIVLICFNSLDASPTDFCKICLNHTLCKYKTQGPSPSCLSYDSSALLTNQDVAELVDRINERRNFVAMGYSKKIPQAANMKKIHWSIKLATFAQRWADQCDPFTQPDREDQCRDLENIKVGQNIGSILGHSPGLRVKGFIEMWFMQILDYNGSVTYYNKSQDYKTKYLTQLIWANTEFIGCGKAKFYVDAKNLMIERLVCNFAPKGNSHGKPVYSMGYPATQCPSNMKPDHRFKGLCEYEDEAICNVFIQHYLDSRFAQKFPVSSLLKILNLSNDSVKHELDPICNNLKQNAVNRNHNIEQRNQKTRHIISNKTYTSVKRIPQLRKQLLGNIYMNVSKNNNDHHHQHDRGHSRLYHGYEPPRYETTILINTNQDFRKYDYSTESSNSYSSSNHRRFNQYQQCTRRLRPTQTFCVSNQCTRAPDYCCQQTTKCSLSCTELLCPQPVQDHSCLTSYITPLPDPCISTQQTCSPINKCHYHTNCPCSMTCFTNKFCHTTVCAEGRRQNNDFNDYRKPSTIEYYDMNPNVVLRSGNYQIPPENIFQKEGSSLKIHLESNKLHKMKYEDNDSDEIHKEMIDYSKYKSPEHDYIYHSVDSSPRKRRQLDKITEKPFWQIENFHYQKPQLKNMRYTTLPQKKYRKTRKNMNSARWLTSTESITLKLVDYDDYQTEHVTEKYLSFDELMHLRKINDEFLQNNFRRTAKPSQATTSKTTKSITTTSKTTTSKTTTSKTTTSKATTSKTTTSKTTTTKSITPKIVLLSNKVTQKNTEFTVNTPFERIKYCTRKLTCTWTAFTANEKGEVQIVGPIEVGPRTPPGYVDGCTRTSTCTRDYMERNRIFTVPDENSTESTPVDEDYCERRSFNVKKRNFNHKSPRALSPKYQNYTTTKLNRVNTAGINQIRSFTESVSTHECICNVYYTRKKREPECSRDNQVTFENDRNLMSYGNLYYLIVNKILRSHQENKCNIQCPCNNSITSRLTMFLFLLIFLNTFYF